MTKITVNKNHHHHPSEKTGGKICYTLKSYLEGIFKLVHKSKPGVDFLQQKKEVGKENP